MRTSSSQRLRRGAAAVLLATAFNHFADRLLGVQIEGFTGGIGYFSFAWVIDLFLVPFLAGLGLAAVFGRGSKWLAMAPPLIVRTVSYFGIAYHVIPLHLGARLMPIGWWGFYLILAMESAMLGGVLGEVMIKRTYGRAPPQKPVQPVRPASR